MPYIGKKPADIIATVIDTTTGTFSGDLTVDTNTLYVDSANNRVGVGTSTVTSGFKLEVTGDARFGDAYNDDAVELGWSAGGSQGFVQAYDRGASAFRNLILNNSVTINSTGNVGIGTGSPSGAAGKTLAINGDSGQSRLALKNTATGDASGDGFQLSVGTDGSVGIEQRENNYMALYTNATERMRIDTSGNLLVGKTSATASAVGVQVQPIGRVYATRDGDVPLVLRRNTSDGNIAQFLKDGTTVGSIGTTSGVLTIDGEGANTGGFYFNGANNILPRKNKAFNSGTIDLGSTSQRWKDLYLSNQAYIITANNAIGRVVFGDPEDNDIGQIAYSHTDNAMFFKTNASERMRITSGGNVGIGTSSPSDTFHVNGNVFIEGSSPEITFETTNSSNNNWQIACQENVSNALEISVGSADADASNDTFSPVAVFTSSGNLLVGSTSITTGTLGSSNRFLEASAGTASGSGTLVLSRNTSANDQEIGGVRFANQNNSTDGSNNNTGKLVAVVSSRSVTTDSNAGDDSGGVLVFSTKPETGTLAERMRIDSSGNLLVGTTTSGGSVDGLQLGADNIARFANSSSVSLVLNRITDDGAVALFRKDNSTVGSIGVNGGQPYFINSSNKGIRPYTNGVAAAGSAGAFDDAAQDLGASSVRWRNLYLSGGVYLGGTGSSNHLDDYEEGTWTAGFGGATVSATNTTGYYTKIGQQVFFNYYSGAMTISSASGGAQITGLPFTSSNNTAQYGLFTYVHGTAVNNSNGGFVVKNTTYMAFISNDNTTSASYVNGSNKYVMVSGHYQTDS
jgi:hypothetical protein